MNVTSSAPNISSLASNLFNKLDTKQKGYLEQSDMQTALSSLNKGSDNSNVSEVFKQLDSDGDGKVTKTELTSSLQTLADTLQSQFQQSRIRGSGQDMGGPPPPPPSDSKADAGFTKDELNAIASDSSTDSKRSELMSKLAANFDAADTDGDGKVTGQEAMAYEQSTRTKGNAENETATKGSDTLNLKVVAQLVQLLQAYGSSSSSTEGSSTLSVAA